MKISLFAFCFTLTILNLSAQRVKISISNPIAEDGTEVFFCRSIDRDPANYIVMYDKTVFKQGNAIKTFDIDSAMFIMIADNPFMPKTRLVVCKGDSIHIQVMQDTIENTKRLYFTGANFKGCQNYYSNPLFLGSKTTSEVHEVLKTATDIKDAIDKTQKLKAELISPMDSLFLQKEISFDYYNYVKLEGDAEFLNAILSVASTISQNFENEKIKLRKSALTDLQKYYCEKYDPFSAKYRNVNYRTANSRRKCHLIADGILLNKSNPANLGLWDKKDSDYNYAPKDIQERMFASDLIFNQKFGMINEANAKKEYQRLKRAFPNSVFLPVIESSFNKEISAIPPFAFARYNKTAKVFNYIEKDSLTTLPAFIKDHFSGRAVMIDMWATYCAPCKIEFAYAKDVQIFLETHGIDLLYFSIDNENNVTGWIKDIDKYNLNGYHYFATDIVSDYLRHYLDQNISIPRYLLFDKNGKLVDGDLPRPSEKKIFQLRILNKLRM
jgi:thiol-disulfide isomerase/thioredoxin